MCLTHPVSMTLIADNGGTTSRWYLLDEHLSLQKNIHGEGYNPNSSSPKQKEMLRLLLQKHFGDHHGTLYFYSAGIGLKKNQDQFHLLLSSCLPHFNIIIEKDLTAAARALHHHQKGVVAILGTGANAGYYDGSTIIHQPISLGWIYGDEGSGAYMGKKIVKDYLEKTMPNHIAKHISHHLNMSHDDFLHYLLKDHSAKYLGSFIPLLEPFHQTDYFLNILEKSFSEFFIHILDRVPEASSLPLSFCGSVAKRFESTLCTVAQNHGYEIKKVIQEPGMLLLNYHCHKNK